MYFKDSFSVSCSGTFPVCHSHGNKIGYNLGYSFGQKQRTASLLVQGVGGLLAPRGAPVCSLQLQFFLPSGVKTALRVFFPVHD